MNRSISISIFLVCLMVTFSSPAFGQAQSTEDLKALNAQLKKLFRQGNYTAAIPVAENIRTTTEQRYGPDHVETANSLNNLVLIYIEQKRYAEAEKLSMRVLKIYGRQLGKNRLCAAMIYDRLEEIYEKTGRPDNAKKAKEKGAEVRRQGSEGEKVICGAMEPLEVMGWEMAKPPPPEAVSAFWNTWFENQANGNRVEELKTGNIYSFVLDISRFSYFKGYTAAVDPSVQKLISDALLRGDTKIRFKIRPILHGDMLRFTDNQPSSLPLNADINKLQKPTDSTAEERIEQKKDEFLAGKIKLRDFAHEVQADEVRFEVLAERAGDTTISISIWDSTGMIPLDHLTLSVSVVDSEAPGVRPGSVSQTVPLRAGRSTLLDVSSDFSSTGPLIADAAFYIFEPSPKGKSIILFAAKKVQADTAVSDQEQGVYVYAWETESLLSQYIGDQNQFLKKIKKARQLAADIDEDKQKYCYQEAADELRKKIFSGLNPKGQTQAAEAEKIFSNLVGLKNQPSVVFVRMRNEKGVPVYLPLGILAARNKNPFLDKRIILVQPLPRERYPGGGHPVEAWTFSVPEQLGGLTEQSNEALEQLGTYTFPRFYRDIPKSRGFLQTVAPSAQDSKPEGILLLAHQAGGNLWSTDESNRIIIEDIKHLFPPGSVAILSACSAAAAEGNNQAILEKLNDNGIDAMIISPFPVDADYGAMLAIHFVEVLEEARASSKRLTMAELFHASAEKTAEHFNKEMNINFEEMALEFLIAGDYRISVAPKQ